MLAIITSFFIRRYWQIQLLLFTSVLILFSAVHAVTQLRSNVYFLDVGQGDAQLIVTENLGTVLIDGGPFDSVLSELGSVFPFYMRRIDVMILTHPHKDHIEGLIEVLKRFQVRHVIFAGDAYKSNLYAEFLAEVGRQVGAGTLTSHFASAHLDFEIDGLVFDILFPFEIVAGRVFENANNASVVVKASGSKNGLGEPLKGGKSVRPNTFLFTGDCEMECEEEIIQYYRGTAQGMEILRSDIFKVGHHGSRTSTTQVFLSAVSPKIAVISLGTDNMFGHPHEQTLNKLELNTIEVHRTDLEGTIKIPLYPRLYDENEHLSRPSDISPERFQF